MISITKEFQNPIKNMIRNWKVLCIQASCSDRYECLTESNALVKSNEIIRRAYVWFIIKDSRMWFDIAITAAAVEPVGLKAY